MNSYIITFKRNIKPKKWISTTLILFFSFSSLIFFVNYIVDPYNIHQYNILNIKYKFSRDDRIEKLNYFKTLNKFSNLIIGSSRILSMNPSIVTQTIGGDTYNFGFGGASVEDQLGLLLYLKKEEKLPKNIILGVDYYTFNPKIMPNKYFLKNKELNFLTYTDFSENYFNKFFSFDAFRASLKTLKHHLLANRHKSIFDQHGWTGGYENYNDRNIEIDLIDTKKEIHKNITTYYSNFQYIHIDPTRKQYYERIKEICRNNNITLYVFTTPLHPELLNILQSNINTNNSMKELIDYLSTFNHFYNFYTDTKFNFELRHFHASTHTSTNAGDIILKKVLLNKP